MTTKDAIRHLEKIRDVLVFKLNCTLACDGMADLREQELAFTHAIAILRRLDDSMPDKRSTASNAAQTAVKPVKGRQKAKQA